jgi:hypothetical protein
MVGKKQKIQTIVSQSITSFTPDTEHSGPALSPAGGVFFYVLYSTLRSPAGYKINCSPLQSANSTK